MSLRQKICWPAAGTYIVAVSGGADSVALLDLLATHPRAAQWQLVAAHFNHGWPGDEVYERVARRVIERYGFEPVVGHGQAQRTEAAARTARYGWLRQMMKERGAAAIITAHHQDDGEETLLLNVLRGTGRQGLSPFRRTPDVLRPLTGVRKAELKAYATAQGLEWCHDSYNDDLKFRRNQVRHELIPRLEAEQPAFHKGLVGLMAAAANLNTEIDAALQQLFVVDKGEATVSLEVARRLEVEVLRELIVAMVQAVRPGVELDRRTIVQLAVDIKSGRLRRRRALLNGLFAGCQRGTVAIVFTP